jgi:hypothetical protein
MVARITNPIRQEGIDVDKISDDRLRELEEMELAKIRAMSKQTLKEMESAGIRMSRKAKSLICGEQIPCDPDLIRLTEKIIEQNGKILEMNAKLLALMNMVALTVPEVTP